MFSYQFSSGVSHSFLKSVCRNDSVQFQVSWTIQNLKYKVKASIVCKDLLLNASKGYLKLLTPKGIFQNWSFCEKRNRWMCFILALVSVFGKLSVLPGSWGDLFCREKLLKLTQTFGLLPLQEMKSVHGRILWAPFLTDLLSWVDWSEFFTWAFYCRDECFYFYAFLREGTVKIRHREM